MKRRTFLTAAAGFMTLLAGCSDDCENTGDESCIPTPETPTPTPTPTDTPTETERRCIGGCEYIDSIDVTGYGVLFTDYVIDIVFNEPVTGVVTVHYHMLNGVDEREYFVNDEVGTSITYTKQPHNIEVEFESKEG